MSPSVPPCPKRKRAMFQTDLLLDYDAPRASLAPVARTFQDAVDHVDQHPTWPKKTCGELKSALRQVAWSMAFIQARNTGQFLDPNRKALDLAQIPFDIPTINAALTGITYRLAGFNSDKSFRNAKSALRCVGRYLGTVAPMKATKLPADSPY